jgi:anti-sigma regulatory factor (Ser/Thr protein kinase)
MKRLWQSSKYKDYQQQRMSANLIRTQKKRRGQRSKQKPESNPKEVRTYFAHEGSYLHLYAPECFSFTDNPESTLKFFASIEGRLLNGSPTFINLHNVRSVSADALMYLLALLDVASQKHGVRTKVRGNIPITGSARDAILASGFTNFVAGLPRDGTGDPDTLQIVSNSLVQSHTAGELLAFAREKLGLERLETRGAFAILVESMSNVVEHAYAESVRFERKWWAMAQCINGGNSVRLTVVDYGDGIAATMRRSLPERVIQAVGMMQDQNLVMSAMRGEVRSRTGKESRGRGLPKMLQAYLDGDIRELTIISSRAYIKGATGQEMLSPLKGTIVSFSLERRCNAGAT